MVEEVEEVEEISGFSSTTTRTVVFATQFYLLSPEP
jgi:hypothetical protein